jgi:hypothetical protein
MSERDPLFPNALIVARREYRDRVRSPFFVVSTILLMALALGVAIAPLAVRFVDRQTVTRIAWWPPTRNWDPGDRRHRQPAHVPPGAVDAAAGRSHPRRARDRSPRGGCGSPGATWAGS